MRERQYTALIRTLDGQMVFHTLHYSDEVDQVDGDLKSDMQHIKVSAPELRMAGELIKSMTKPLHLEEFKDEFREQLQALVDAKTHGKEIADVPTPKSPPPRTINLMEALKKSLAGGSAATNGRTSRSTSRRPAVVPARHRRRSA
jgi:DNA end-binding protein Ku